MNPVTFFVPGRPIPKGSAVGFKHRHSGKVIVRQHNADSLYAWEERIYSEAFIQLGAPLAGPVRVDAQFILARPKNHYHPNGTLRMLADPWPKVRPDVDKLYRAVLDGLSGVAYRDDAQVIGGLAWKRYALPNEREGVVLRVEKLVAPHDWYSCGEAWTGSPEMESEELSVGTANEP